MKAAIYCRVSTEDQQREGTSLRSQLEACRKLALEKGYETSEEYVIQEVYSGLTLQRPDLARLRGWLQGGDLDAVVIYSSDRFSRDGYDFLTLIRDCRQAGVELLCVTEPLEDGQVGELLSYVRGWASKLEAEKIKDRTMRGKKTRALDGRLPTGGMGLYGYDYVPGKGPGEGTRKVNEIEARTVRNVFCWLIHEGLSTKGICRKLVANGVPAPRGGQPWSTATVGRMLRNLVYTGKTYAFKMKAVESRISNAHSKHQTKTRRELRPKDEWIELRGATPAIISESLFESAQEQLGRNRDLSPRNKKHDYLLRGLVYCRQCGRKYYGEPEHHRCIYRCSSRRQLGLPRTCHNRSHDADWLDREVWERVKSLLVRPELLVAELQRRHQEIYEGNLLENNLEIVEAKLAKSKKRKDHAWRGLEITGDEATFREAIAMLDKEVGALIADKSELERQIRAKGQWNLDRDSVRKFCETAVVNIKNFTFGEKRLAVEALRIVVWIDDDSIDIEGVIPMEKGRIASQRS